jgi:hypothetical protein
VVAKGTDNASVVVDDVSGLKAWDKVMIIQMKGGFAMSTKDDNTFGTVTDYSNVGNYEFATICKIDPVTKTLYFLNEFSKTYDFGGGKGPKATEMGRVQVVRVPVYESYTVTGSLEPMPWDSTTGKGGVLAIIVEDDLTLNGNISADGKGFKGGKFEVSGGDCAPFDGQDNFYYNPSNLSAQDGAYKGESVFRIDMSIAGGKGANANGGGGGNNHNNGGAGGANLAGGGNGGGNSSDGVFTCRNSDPGIGGIGINVGSADRIFLGGGGGAGHVNNLRQNFAPVEEFVGGGNGGGIIFIQAGNLISNGYSITANGIRGGNQQGDGASGGGAGGTIIMNVAGYTGAVTIQANGGKGGDFDNEGLSGKCYGEGGGGSGGVVYFKGTAPGSGVSVSGGKKGERNSIAGCVNVTWGTDGKNGSSVGGYSYALNSAISSNCPDAATLPVKLAYFKAAHKGSYVATEWKVENPEDGYEYSIQRKDGNGSWKSIHTMPAEESTTLYRKGDGPLGAGTYLYRLRIVEKDRSVAYSDIQRVTVSAEDISRMVIYPNPSSSEIAIVTPAQDDEWLSIYDMKSRLVYRKKVVRGNPVIRQDISFLSEGVYLVQVGKLTARFVVFK